jgi:predicted AAA+ superfamily ATPase
MVLLFFVLQMIARYATKSIRESAKHFKVVSVLGPRQSGKTTLCRAVFPKKPYVSLEPLDTRIYAQEDPRGFLNQFPRGAILDEVQNTPELFSYIQDVVDTRKEKGLFVLTGSQNFTLSAEITQSLAGRTAIEILMPLHFQEIKSTSSAKFSVWETIWQGGYPELFAEKTPVKKWMESYIRSYLERDVRQIANVGDLRSFRLLLALLAGSTGQEINYNRLSIDVGVSHNTIKRWVGILEQSFLVHFTTAFHVNTRKQILKKPKLYFVDTGIVCALLGIDSAEQLRLHPLRGHIFETWVVSEIYKRHLALGRVPRLSHYRENSGIEFDCVDETDKKILYEIKSGETVQSSFLKNFSILAERADNAFKDFQKTIVYGGASRQSRNDVRILPWSDF